MPEITQAVCATCNGAGRLADDIPCPACTPAKIDPMARLVSLRSRLLRAREQANLLRTDLPPMFQQEIEQISQQLIATWLQVSDIIDTMAPNGINDSDEDIKAEQKRLASVMKRIQRGDALKGIVDDEDFFHD